MECTRDNVVLLFLCELDEVYSIAGNSYCELGVLLGVSLSVEESFPCEDVHVEVVTALFNVAVEQFDEVVYLFLIIHSKSSLIFGIVSDIFCGLTAGTFYAAVSAVYGLDCKSLPVIGGENVYMACSAGHELVNEIGELFRRTGGSSDGILNHCPHS